MNETKPSVWLQSVKALCYFALFIVTQFIVSIFYTFYAAIKIRIEELQNGRAELSVEEVTERISQMLGQDTVLLVILYGIPTLLILWLFFLIRRKKPLAEMNIVPFPVRLMPQILMIALGVTGFVNTALSLLPESWLESYNQSSEFLVEGTFVTTLIATGICAPIVEEIIFRGLIFSRLKKALPVPLSMLFSSLLFGLAHGQILWIAYTFLLGLLFCVVAQRTGSILPTIIIHALFNGLGVCLAFSSFEMNWFTFFGMLIGGAILLIAGTVLLIRSTRTRRAAPAETEAV